MAMKKIFYICLLQGIHFLVSGQPVTDSSLIIGLNQQIDDHVVQKNVAILEKLYADDFVFSHGSGRVEGRQSGRAGWARWQKEILFQENMIPLPWKCIRNWPSQEEN